MATQRAASPAFGGIPRNELVAELHQVVISDFEKRISESVEELLANGFKALHEMQEAQKAVTLKLSEDLTMCCQRNQALAVENQELNQLTDEIQQQIDQMFACHNFVDWPPVEEAYPQLEAEAVELPPVPPFPFPALPVMSEDARPSTPPGLTNGHVLPSPTRARMPVSLADALEVDSNCPPSTSSASPLTGMSSAFSTASTLANVAVPAGRQGRIFTINLHKQAAARSLGLSVVHGNGYGKVLHISAIRPGGMVDVWNQQCLAAGSTTADQVVLPGDRIASVNNIAYDAAKMLEEVAESETLKLLILRAGEVDEFANQQQQQTGGEVAAMAPVTVSLSGLVDAGDGSAPMAPACMESGAGPSLGSLGNPATISLADFALTPTEAAATAGPPGICLPPGMSGSAGSSLADSLTTGSPIGLSGPTGLCLADSLPIDCPSMSGPASISLADSLVSGPSGVALPVGIPLSEDFISGPPGISLLDCLAAPSTAESTAAHASGNRRGGHGAAGGRHVAVKGHQSNRGRRTANARVCKSDHK
eukprot:gnl/TRDRNA2_/TRDRNA2_193204_c0_seq1.p1 gnl/TRDRNA2_/TRDRNA2_193204_c0~~gnl/TRDRNA2_/TRDRNA2_193204_c0_seq1.p1  ORF type:complete len:536 (+),score=103.10 gnl/TRDRNA2_/TRDRNA2_193204_c0_seq1:99-1706(+)